MALAGLVGLGLWCTSMPEEEGRAEGDACGVALTVGALRALIPDTGRDGVPSMVPKGLYVLPGLRAFAKGFSSEPALEPGLL